MPPAIGRLAQGQRALQRRQGQRGVILHTGRPSDDAARREIEDDGQMCEARPLPATFAAHGTALCVRELLTLHDGREDHAPRAAGRQQSEAARRSFSFHFLQWPWS